MFGDTNRPGMFIASLREASKNFSGGIQVLCI